MTLTDKPSGFWALVKNVYWFLNPLYCHVFKLFITIFVISITFERMRSSNFIYLSNKFNEPWIIIIFKVAMAFAFAVLTQYFISAQLARGYGVMSNNERFITQTWKIAADRCLKATMISIFTSLLVSGPLFIIFLASRIIGHSIGLLLLLAVLKLLTSIWALYIVVRLNLTLPMLIVFDKRIFTTIKQSWHLTRQRFWKTFGVLFIGVMIPFLTFFSVLVIFSDSTGPVEKLIYYTTLFMGCVVVTSLKVSTSYVLLNDYLIREDSSILIKT